MIQILHRADARSKAFWGAAIVTTVAVLVVLAVAMTTRTQALTGNTYVTPTDEQGWTSLAPLADTRKTGVVEIVADDTALYGDASLRLATGSIAPINGVYQDKAQYMKAAGVPLSEITTLGYSTKQIEASFAAGLPSFQLAVCLNGLNPDTEVGGCADIDGSITNSFTTLVYEPYVDQGNAAVLNNTWQTWDVDAGKLWSSKDVDDYIVSTQGEVTYTLADIQERYPNAVLAAFGVNVGSNNPSYDTRVDGVTVNDVVYDFELEVPEVVLTPTTKEECKDGGWQTLVNTNGVPFRNQGQCVSFVTTSF